MTRINYKQQLERLQEIMNYFFADKLIGNAFTEFDKGHQTAIKDLNDGIRILIKRALKGKLIEREYKQGLKDKEEMGVK